MVAVAEGVLENVKMLCNHGAQVNIQNMVYITFCCLVCIVLNYFYCLHRMVTLAFILLAMKVLLTSQRIYLKGELALIYRMK